MTNDPSNKPHNSNNNTWFWALIAAPFLLMPLAKCMDERNGTPKPPNPFDPAIQNAVRNHMEKYDNQSLSKEEFNSISQEALMREYNSRKQ